MAKIRLTREFSFESAHALEGYDGACREVHGHSYKLFVTIIGEPIADLMCAKCGMVMDFGELKRIVNEQIVDRLDHSFVLRRSAAAEGVVAAIGEIYQNVQLVEYQPTCENMLSDFAQRIMAQLPDGVALHSLKLHETERSFAEWYAEDNL